jgi:hypothetical protein
MTMHPGNANEPALSFTRDFDEMTAWEAEQKGWFECGVVTLPGGLRIPVSFWDPVRLAQDLQEGLKAGRVCLAEPALIVVPSVTREYMERAVGELFRSGYFDRLVGLGNSGNSG